MRARDTTSDFVRLFCCSPAPHGAYLAPRCVPVGTGKSRGSLSQDSRATEAGALDDPLGGSDGDRRCAGRTEDVMAGEEAITWAGAPRHFAKRRKVGAPVGECAYVTSCGRLVTTRVAPGALAQGGGQTAMPAWRCRTGRRRPSTAWYALSPTPAAAVNKKTYSSAGRFLKTATAGDRRRLSASVRPISCRCPTPIRRPVQTGKDPVALVERTGVYGPLLGCKHSVLWL